MRVTFSLLVCAFFLFASLAKASPLAIDFEPVALDPANPKNRTVGKLRYRGGLELSSADKRFGGLSALLISPDGQNMTALTDKGDLIKARLDYSGGDLAGIAGASIHPLIGLDGNPLDGKKNTDAESLAVTSEGGFTVSFERHHRLWRYPSSADLPYPLEPPQGLSLASKNGGVEALVMLGDGRLVAITESFGAPSEVVGWIRGKGGAWSRFTYETGGRYNPTGATRLPDGDIVVVERRYTLIEGPSARLSRIPARAFQPGARILGQRLAYIAHPLSIDNMEGVAARKGPRGKTLLYLLSDDNFHSHQRTLLFLFELAE